ncbi:TnsA endonuclease N-terminal domain-containing protein [Cupriavidus basilensis]
MGGKLPEWDICGIPTGRRYRPWHSARVGKRGLSGNWVRIKTGTGSPQHSLIEAKALAKFDFHTWVLEARSQYPFWDAEKYLRYYRAGRPFPKTSVATFDFMLTLCIPWTQELHYHCVSIKPSGQLDDAKVVRRHEREAKWCAERGITWECLTELDFPEREYWNHKVLKRFLRDAGITRQMADAREYAERVSRSSASGSLNHLLKCANRRWTLLECYQMFGVAVLMGWLRIDHRFPLEEGEPLFLERT